MPGTHTQRPRKGTKSCTECRRRKIRCIKSFENAQICRRCEERGSKCISQVHRSSSTRKQRLSPIYPVAQHESRVHALSETEPQTSQKLNVQPMQNGELNVGQTFAGSSDGHSSVSELSIAEQPSHLRLLFQNNWLSLDHLSQGGVIKSHETTKAACLLSTARNSLQGLIPSKDEIFRLTHSCSEWLIMLHSFFQLPFGAKCGMELIASYQEMHSPNVDTMRLASWLLDVALIAEQLPPKYESMEARLDQRERQKWLSNAISEAVDNTILVHDILTGSIHGLSVFIQFIRLEMGRGNIRKAWLKLRHAIAIAEIMGLHNMVHIAKPRTATEAVDKAHISKLRLWNVICAADRLLGMILGLPPVTSRYQQAMPHSVSVNGVVQTQVYLCRLTDIVHKIQHLDHLSLSDVSRPECYTLVSELSRELKTLASQTPESWWLGSARGTNNVHPDDIVQFLHYYITMRAHLPLALRPGPGGENTFSCLACVEACESMLQRYQFLSRRLPRGLFISEMLDLQAFSAAVILLLMSHMSSVRFLGVGIDRIKISNEVRQVIELLHEKSDTFPSSENTRNSFTTLCSLDTFIRGTEGSVDLRQIDCHAPLLGKVQITRNGHPSQAGIHWSPQMLPALCLFNASDQLPYLQFDASMSMDPPFDTENVQWARTASSTEGSSTEGSSTEVSIHGLL